MVKEIVSSSRLSYAGYIRLSSILSSQVPLSPREDIGVWATERYFIVCHQISELLASQILADLKYAAQLISSHQNWGTVRTLLVRAASLALQFYQQSEQLACLCPQHAFLKFRTLLEGASASESKQFRELLNISTGDHPHRKTVERALLSRMDSFSTVPSGVVTQHESEAWSIAEALSVLTNAITIWRELHIVITAHFIAGSRGTGGTAGVEYLLRRMQASGGGADPKDVGNDPSFSSGSFETFCGMSVKNINSKAQVLNERVRLLQPAFEGKMGNYFTQAKAI